MILRPLNQCEIELEALYKVILRIGAAHARIFPPDRANTYVG
jgi:hypothetical protein